jgi:DNA-binding MarR family transcriptional regulator
MSSSEPPQYVASLPFLLSQVGARSAQIFTERLAPLGISPRGYVVLSNLAAAGDSPTQQQLADALGIHRNNMVGLIDELEAAGWVQRHRSTRDRRAFGVRLTEAGFALVGQINRRQINRLIPALDDELAQGLTDTERKTMVALLKQVALMLELRPGVHPHLGGRAR